MYCPQCGNEVQNGSVKCISCNYHVGDLNIYPENKNIGSISQSSASMAIQNENNTNMGKLSFVLSLIMGSVWIVLLISSVITASSGKASEGLFFIVGIFMFIGCLVNALGIVLGIISVVKNEVNKTQAITGLTLNVFESLGIFLLMIIGMSS